MRDTSPLEIDLIYNERCLSPVNKMSKSGDSNEILRKLVRSYTITQSHDLSYKNSKPEMKKYRKELRLMNYGEK